MQRSLAQRMISLTACALLAGASSTHARPQESPAAAGLTSGDWGSIRGAIESDMCEVQETARGFEARNPRLGWISRFDSAGVTAGPKGKPWGLELASWGFEGAQTEVNRAAEVSADGDRVSLRWSDALTEWWVNDRAGLEHGFTVHQRPASGCETTASHTPPCPSGEVTRWRGPLSFYLDVRGELTPRVTRGRRGAEFVDSDGASVLQYSGLVAFDADGAGLDAWMEISGEQLVLCVDDSDAEYPIIVDPWVHATYLKASNTGPIDLFGISVAVQGDSVFVGALWESGGGTGVNGGAQDDNSVFGAGAVYEFVRTPVGWEQRSYIKASNPGFEYSFGSSLAIDGDTLVVGSMWESGSGTGVNSGTQSTSDATYAGAAYVFRRSGGTWAQEAYIKASNTDRLDEFGFDVAISGDTIVVGAPSESSDGSSQADNSAFTAGAAYVFKRVGSTWTQEAYLKASNVDARDRFGASVGISGDLILIGAGLEDGPGRGVNPGSGQSNSSSDSGAAYVFTRAAGAWTQTAYIKASNADFGDRFARSVAIDGATAVISAAFEDGPRWDRPSSNDAPESGAAYVFEFDGADWRETAYLKALNLDAGDWFGGGVAICGDTLVVTSRREGSGIRGAVLGGPTADQAGENAPDSGAAYVFERAGAAWRQHAYLKASNSEQGDGFGTSVACDGATIVVGSPTEESAATGVNSGGEADNSLQQAGAAYIYFNDPSARPVGARYCEAAANSTGRPARLAGLGSSLVSSGDVVLLATDLPPHTFGFFLGSRDAGFTPGGFGSQGNLCLGGSIGRFVGPGEVRYAGAAGEFGLALDLSEQPTPQGTVQIQPGETWRYTAWYRDEVSGQATSNFTDALAISYQ